MYCLCHSIDVFSHTGHGCSSCVNCLNTNGLDGDGMTQNKWFFYNHNITRFKKDKSLLMRRLFCSEGAACQYTVTPPTGCLKVLNNSML